MRSQRQSCALSWKVSASCVCTEGEIVWRVGHTSVVVMEGRRRVSVAVFACTVLQRTDRVLCVCGCGEFDITFGVHIVVGGGSPSSVSVRAEEMSHATRARYRLSFMVKRGVPAATGVRVGTDGESAFLSIAALSFCLGYYVKAWQVVPGG